MSETKTVIGSQEATENSVTLYGVEKIKTTEVNEDGRVYVSRDYARSRVRYTLVDDGLLVSVGAPDGAVVMNDVVEIDTAKVLKNGYIVVGSEYVGHEVTVAIKRIEPGEEPTAKTGGSGENNQTAETPS